MSSRTIHPPVDPGAPDYSAQQEARTSPLRRTMPVRPTRTATFSRSLGTDSSAPDVLFDPDPTRAQGAVYNGTGDTLYVAGGPDGPWFPVADATYYDHGATGPLYGYMGTTAATLVAIEERY